ncbi:MAG: DUF4011 domain-containing protein [Azoarcus sp.]|nr:DUF4011 domain-containing protein [Azoarcus sp.]
MSSTVYETLSQTASGIRLQVEFLHRVDAALIASGFPFVRAVAVHNETRHTLASIELTVGLTAGNRDSKLAVYREDGPTAPGQTVYFDGVERFREFSRLIEACRAEAVATLTIDVCPILSCGEAGGDSQWPALTAMVEIGPADEFLTLPALRQAIAGHVRPAEPAVQKLLRVASSILLGKTGSAAADGYQGGIGRAKLIAEALYQAMRGENLTCVDLPTAAFEAAALPVKPAAQVLQAQTGNGLDLAVLYAACCEGAGLQPIIVFTSARVFPAFVAVSELEYSLALGGEKGFEFLGETVVSDPSVIARLIESKTIVPVDLGGLGSGKQGVSFRGATKRAVDYARSYFRELKAAVSIPQCRKESAPASLLLPLKSAATAAVPAAPDKAPPAAPGGADRSSASISPPQASVPPAEASPEPLASRKAPDEAPERIRQWKRALFDPARRPPLLDLSGDGHVLDLLIPNGMLAGLADALRKGKKLRCVSDGHPALQSGESGPLVGADSEFAKGLFFSDYYVFSNLDRAAHERRLRLLRRDAKMRLLETGSPCLYLTLGTLTRPGHDGGQARAPLFLLPVRLGGGQAGEEHDISLAGEPVPLLNPCLDEWLRNEQGIEFDDLAKVSGKGSVATDLVAAFAAMRDSLRRTRLSWRIDERAALALLDLTAFRLWQDVDRHWRGFMDNTVVRHLVERRGETFTQPVTAEEAGEEDKPWLPLPADGSQRAAAAAAIAGKSFVLEGAPGAGKSQTAANLIAHALLAGKRVLFVAGKEAALDAVAQRLENAGLRDFVLDAHSSSLDLPTVRKQLKRALREAVDESGAAWKAARARHGDALAALRDYRDRVHAPNTAGFSLWSAYDTLAKLGPGPGWELDPRALSRVDAEAMSRALNQAVHVMRQIGAAHKDFWLLVGLEDVGKLTFTTLTSAIEELGAVRKRVVDLGGSWRDALKELRPGKYLAAVNECIAANKEGLLPSKAHFRDIQRQSWRDATANLRRRLAAFLDDNGDALQTFGAGLIESPQLNDWIMRATRLAGVRLLAETRRKPVREAVVAALAHPEGVDLNGDGLLAALRSAQDLRGQALELGSLAAGMSGLMLPPGWGAYRPNALQKFDAAVHLAQTAVWLERHAPAAWLKVQEPKANAEIEALQNMEAAWNGWLAIVGANERSIEQWLGGRPWLEAWDEDAPRWADDLAGPGLLQLQRHAWLRKELRALDRAGAPDLADKLARRVFALEEAGSVMQRGLAMASLRERLVATGLTAFDEAAQENVVAAFMESARELRRLAAAAGPARLCTLRAVITARAGNGAESPVAALMRQIERKRGGIGVREMFVQHTEALLTITPALLMSPGAVARYLAPDVPRFDLVIIDESSRLRVAEALGALGRGGAAVIVGDTKQLPPAAPANLSAEPPATPTFEPTSEEADSILAEAVDAGLPRLHLEWHYRSVNEALFTFSNARYYENELLTLPPVRDERASTVLLRRVMGGELDAQRANRTEARAVVDEILARLHDPLRQRETLGVVCLAAGQRDLLLDLLEETPDAPLQEALSAAAERCLFVKTIDDVQGDERDVILLSFASTRGAAADFAPLTGNGGERWLNVAITRARLQTLSFVSFKPESIELAEATPPALRDLKDYLTFASDGDTLAQTTVRDGLSGEIAAALEARGYVVQCGIGRSAFRVDLAVKKPGDERWRLAVVADGPAWKSRRTVADRDAAPFLLQERANWPAVARVWLPGWLRDKEGVLERLVGRIESVTGS